MTSLLVNANDVKLALMMLHRFQYGAFATVTEAGSYQADVLVINKKFEIVEFEVKISITDLKADFKKYEKHMRYKMALNETDEERIHTIPHYFYFVVPDFLLNEAVAYLAKYPKYGIMTFNNERFRPSSEWIDTTGFLKTIRRSKLLRNMKITTSELYSLQKRLSNELIREKIKAKLRG